MLFSTFFPLKVSGSILDVYSGEQEISPVNMGLTSASCPSSLPIKREITGNAAFIVFFKKKKKQHFCKTWVTYNSNLKTIFETLSK